VTSECQLFTPTLSAQARTQSEAGGFKPPGRRLRRWRISKVYSCIYEVYCSSACASGFATRVETMSPP